MRLGGNAQSVGALEKGGGDGKSSSRRVVVMVWWGGIEEKERRRPEGDHTTKGLSEFFLFLIKKCFGCCCNHFADMNNPRLI